jgi:hypothetical protein
MPAPIFLPARFGAGADPSTEQREQLEWTGGIRSVVGQRERLRIDPALFAMRSV